MEEIKSADHNRQIMDIETIYNEYMAKKGKKFDYADTLTFALNSIKTDAKWRFISIDEAQDLSKPHWEIIKKHIIPNAEYILIAGDPTQSIHEWAGAEPNYFLRNEEIPAVRTIELKESFRIPENHIPMVNALQRQMTDGTAHFQITTKKPGGRIDHMEWGACLEFLRSQAEGRHETLVLSLNSYQLGVISADMIDAGVLFMQDKRSDFAPWSPTVTKSDWYAYSLYYHIWNKQYDATIPYGKVWSMLESAPSLLDIWANFADPAEKDRATFLISVEDLMQVLGIDKDITELELVQTLFEWPPKNRRLLVSGKSRKKELDLHLNKAHHRILRYMESCGEGPYVEPVIKLSTVHGAKGLEADTVILLLSRDDMRGADDRRKLCINAVCRSRNRVVMTWITDEVRLDQHPLKDRNLSSIMTDEEYSKHLDGRWYKEENADGLETD
jgi:superfamily I DNA/RNA helicase